MSTWCTESAREVVEIKETKAKRALVLVGSTASTVHNGKEWLQ